MNILLQRIYPTTILSYTNIKTKIIVNLVKEFFDYLYTYIRKITAQNIANIWTLLLKV